MNKRFGGMLRPFVTTILLGMLSLNGKQVSASAPPSFRMETHIDRFSVSIDESLDVRVDVHGVFDRFVPPRFIDFEVIGSFKKTRTGLKEGKRVTWREFHYRIRPKALDRLVIGGAVVKMGDNILAKGQDIVVTVTNPPAPLSARKARELLAARKGRVAIVPRSDKDTYWVGEPIVVSWDLLSPVGQDVRPISVERAPRMDGITGRENLTFDTSPRTFSHQGESFQRRPFSKVVVYKNEPGRLVIGSMRLLTKTDDGFGKARLVTRPFYVDVKPLPKGQPDSFRAHQVGAFELRSRVVNSQGAKATVGKAGEILYVEAQVSGRGNLRGIHPPILEGSEHFRVRQVRALREETFRQDGQGISGTRQFRFELKPRTVGVVPLPKVTFGAFDPTQEAYVVRRHSHGTLRVRSVMQVLYGGQLLEGNSRGIRFESGWPHTSLTYVIPVTPKLELSPKVTFRYGHQLRADRSAFEPGAELRWNLFQSGSWRFALHGEPALILESPESDDGMEFGVRLGVPGILASVQLTPDLNATLGVRLPASVIFGDKSRLIVPLLADAGIDSVVVDDGWNLNVGALLSAGPEFCVGSCESVSPHLRFSVTSSVIW